MPPFGVQFSKICLGALRCRHLTLHLDGTWALGPSTLRWLWAVFLSWLQRSRHLILRWSEHPWNATGVGTGVGTRCSGIDRRFGRRPRWCANLAKVLHLFCQYIWQWVGHTSASWQALNLRKHMDHGCWLSGGWTKLIQVHLRPDLRPNVAAIAASVISSMSAETL